MFFLGPGSFFEIRKLLPFLVMESKEHPSFHVVAISLPGFGFSQAPKKKGFAIAQHAEVPYVAHISLPFHSQSFLDMPQVDARSRVQRIWYVGQATLPIKRRPNVILVAQGGDWGSVVRLVLNSQSIVRMIFILVVLDHPPHGLDLWSQTPQSVAHELPFVSISSRRLASSFHTYSLTSHPGLARRPYGRVL
jgi:hypothetical protein